MLRRFSIPALLILSQLLLAAPSMAHGFPDLKYVSVGMVQSLAAHEVVRGVEVTGGRSFVLGGYGGTFKSIASNQSVGGFVTVMGVVFEGGMQYRGEVERLAPYGALGFSLGFFEISTSRTYDKSPGGDIQVALKIPYFWE